jgi:hypothetical protein
MPSGDLRSLALGLGPFRWGQGVVLPPEPEPSLAIGWQTLAGLAHEAAEDNEEWPSPQPARVRALFPILGATYSPGVQQTHVVTRAQALAPTALDTVQIAPGLTLNARWRYQGFETVLACGLGYMAPEYPQALSGGAYRHLYEVATDLSREPWDAVSPTTSLHQRLTCALWRQVSVWELWSSLVTSLTLTSADVVTGALALQGYALSRQSTVNTVQRMHQLTPGAWPLVSARQAALRLGPYSATTPLTEADTVCYSRLTLAVANPLRTTFGPRTGLHPEEYVRETAPQVTLHVELPRYASDQWLERWDMQTPLMAQWRCTGGLIGSSGQAYQLCCSLPLLRTTNAVPGPVAVGLPGLTLDAIALVPDMPAAGMPGGSRPGPLLVEVVSGEAAHPLLT